MLRRSLLLAAVAVLTLLAPAYSQSVLTMPDPNAPKPAMAPGQLWIAKGNQVNVTIVKLEPWKDQTAVLVSLRLVKCPPKPKCDKLPVAFAPFEAKALENSLDMMVGYNFPPIGGFEKGEAMWKKADGTLLSMSVDEAVAAMDEAEAQGRTKLPEQPAK